MNQKMVYCRLQKSIKFKLDDLSKAKRLSKTEIVHTILHFKPDASDIPGIIRGRGRKAMKTARVGVKLGGAELKILAMLTSDGATKSRILGNIVSNYFLNEHKLPRRRPYTISAANKRIKELEREIKNLNKKVEVLQKDVTSLCNQIVSGTPSLRSLQQKVPQSQ